MKNPYYINFLWLSIIIIALISFLFGPCIIKDYCITLKPGVENILLGILSSAIHLLLIEIINCITDRCKYGFLKGQYRKHSIAQKNEDGLRSSNIPKEIDDYESKIQARVKIEKNENNE